MSFEFGKKPKVGSRPDLYKGLVNPVSFLLDREGLSADQEASLFNHEWTPASDPIFDAAEKSLQARGTNVTENFLAPSLAKAPSREVVVPAGEACVAKAASKCLARPQTSGQSQRARDLDLVLEDDDFKLELRVSRG